MCSAFFSDASACTTSISVSYRQYLGYTSKGVVQLLMTLLSCGFLGAVSWIWGLVEGIMILTGSINQDGRGLPLKD